MRYREKGARETDRQREREAESGNTRDKLELVSYFLDIRAGTETK